MKDPSNLLIGQPDGTFVEEAEAAGLLDFGRARGAVVVDLNGDGALDIVTVVRRENVRLWRNDGIATEGVPEGTMMSPIGNWLGVVLDQDAPNHDAIGAWVAVRIGERTVQREVTIGGGHASGSLGPHPFRPRRGEQGAGAGHLAGRRGRSVAGRDAPNGIVRIVRGAAAAEPWTP